MPRRPDPPLVFPAFRTPAGLEPQAALEHTSHYAEATGQAAQLDQRTRRVWRNFPYTRGLFGTDSGATFTVDKANAYTLRYRLLGPELHVRFLLVGSLLAAANVITIALPESLRVPRGVFSESICYGSDAAGVAFPAFLSAQPLNQFFGIYKIDFSAWNAPATVVLRGTFMIEVEP